MRFVDERERAPPDRGPDEEDDVGSWVMAVEVTPSELVAAEVGRGTGATPRPRSEAVGSGPDPVDALADAFERVLQAPLPDDDRPARLVVATPPDTERRRFEEIAEASALVGLPAPSWLPGPVALVGDRIAAEVEIGGRAVVLDARDGGLTAWPVLRTADGAEVGGRGPVATGTRLDQLLLGVVRAQMRSLDPTAVSGAPRPDSRGTADARGDAARLRREVRRARARLAEEDVEEARVPTGGPTVTIDRAVFDQLVEHALRETTAELAGPGGDDAPVYVLVDHPSPLAARLAALTQSPGSAGSEPVLPGDSHDGVLGLAALLLPARPRPTRAASGAQAIRARRIVGPPSPVPVGAGRGSGSGGGGPEDPGSGAAAAPGAAGTVAPLEPPTPPRGTPLPENGHEPGDGDAEPRIPAARIPSTPVQAQHRSGPDEAVARPANGIGSMMAFGSGAAGEHTGGHAVLAEAAPHEARPVSDAPPGGSAPFRRDEPQAEQRDGSGPTAVRPARRGPDTAPQPIPAPRRTTSPARGAVVVLALLVVVAVLAAAGVLLIGPDQIGAAFGGLGTGTAWLSP
ncbi:hypothetical protein [Actinomycetospora atypica]|uniref:Uncharacterized protein n=1 Tax=Actinomycetospora atypica TaxID=1290095 RepID=A0ABV9YHG1_9PSEU